MDAATSSYYAISVLHRVLIYSPLQRITALTNGSAAQTLRRCLETGGAVPRQIQSLYKSLKETPSALPAAQQNHGIAPLFLGIIPTRSCSLQCVYCDFITDQSAGSAMSLPMVKQVIDAYFEILDEEKSERADIQFFGGEPFYSPEVVYFSVVYARRKAEERAMDIHFEVTTNGIFSADVAAWVADHFDAVILSLDGPMDIQESQRPARNGKPVFPIVYNNAKIISSGSADLILRSCISQKTARRIMEITAWIVEEFHPKAVCFESVHPTGQSKKAGLFPPGPVEFARQFHASARILEAHGIAAVHSTTDVSICRTTICPVGRNALIISPDGAVDACYLPEKAWRDAGLEFRLGKVRAGKFDINENVLQGIRRLANGDKPSCVNCLCRYHCAGGCHVRQNGNRSIGRYDNTCMQTRLVTITNLLRRLNENDLATEWLTDEAAMARFACQSSDHISEMA
ncbi:MAG: radical SAM protein [Chloroflexi bacterium]|nr:radical SAM protein [Chloroflexota bacterium]